MLFRSLQGDLAAGRKLDRIMQKIPHDSSHLAGIAENSNLRRWRLDGNLNGLFLQELLVASDTLPQHRADIELLFGQRELPRIQRGQARAADEATGRAVVEEERSLEPRGPGGRRTEQPENPSGANRPIRVRRVDTRESAEGVDRSEERRVGKECRL